MLNADDLNFFSECFPFIGQLNKGELNIIAESTTKAAYAPGEAILSREKECNGVVALKSGQLRAYFETEDGKEITLYRLFPKDVCILTASCVLKNITFEVTLEAEKDSIVYIIPAQKWRELAERNLDVKEFSMELVNERFSEVMWVMEQMVSKKMGQRVAAFLIEQSALENSDTLFLTHETIAKNLGTAREVVSRILKYLENDGMLKLSRGRIILTDSTRLRSMSRQPSGVDRVKD